MQVWQLVGADVAADTIARSDFSVAGANKALSVAWFSWTTQPTLNSAPLLNASCAVLLRGTFTYIILA